MLLNLSDTLSASRKTPPDGPITLYVCGVTPYDTTHLGHAFTFVQFDTLVRALRFLYPGREVTYVQNVTDIDDSILARARKLGVDWKVLGDQQTDMYRADMRALNVEDPTHFVRATSAMDTMRDLIGRLIERGSAYVAEGANVYFRMLSAPNYGALSRLSREEMLQVASQQDDADVDDPRKEHPLDWALWKGWSGRPDEPFWQSPWGQGRPGWHIECSALCLQYLGPQVTIHGGGADLVYPHHESEIAQSEIATGAHPFVQIWTHVAMVRMDGQKMSKSLGNMVFVRDLLKTYSANAIRLYLLAQHYRQVWEWSPAGLENAASLAERLALAAQAEDSADDGQAAAFAEALADDLNTPRAIEILDTVSGRPLRALADVLGVRL